MNIDDQVTTKGDVTCTIEYKDGRKEERHFKNTVLRTGRYALASSLANDYGDDYDFFIARMIFGNSGTNGGAPKLVNTERNGLFGVTVLTKAVSASVSTEIPSQVVFTSVIAFDEANGYNLSEMALRMNDGDLYSMVTFGDLAKTSTMQITWSWRCAFV